MLYSQFLANVGVMGSDHAIQGIQVQEGEIRLRGFTHNMLNQMHDLEHCPSTNVKYTNNPLNYQENECEYIERKKRQLDNYIGKIANPDLSYDFAFLQEVDIFFNKSKDTESLREKKKELREDFINRLEQLGWKMAKTQLSHDTKQLVTLYKSSSLKFKSSTGTFKDSQNNHNTAFEVNFTYVKSNKPVSLTNVHLDYNKSGAEYSREFSSYLNDKTRSGHITVIGGDTNHPREDLVGAIGPTRFATSFDLDKDTQHLSLRYRLSREKMSSIDTFFVSPSRLDKTIIATPMDCEIFTPDFKVAKMPLIASSSTSIVPMPAREMAAEIVQTISTILRNSDSGMFGEVIESSPAAASSSTSYAPMFSQKSSAEIVRTNTSSFEKPGAGMLIRNLSLSASSVSSSRISVSEPIVKRPSFDALKKALSSFSGKHELMIRYENNQYVVGIEHDELSSSRSAANTTMRSIADKLLVRGIERENHGGHIRKSIDGFAYNGKNFRVIRLNDNDAISLVASARQIMTPRMRIA